MLMAPFLVPRRLLVTKTLEPLDYVMLQLQVKPPRPLPKGDGHCRAWQPLACLAKFV
jgi:hypothetical protein